MRCDHTVFHPKCLHCQDKAEERRREQESSANDSTLLNTVIAVEAAEMGSRVL